jgi:4-hydroxy-tetrahydrodipicolinate synthase
MSAHKIKGIIPPLVTPLDDDENVDEGGLRALVDRAVETKLDAVFVAGSGGEAMSLTQAERDRAIRIVLDEAAGRLPVLAGVMDSSTRRVIENLKRFEDMGGEHAVVTPAFYIRNSSQGEIVTHFEQIARRASVKIFAYNIPGNTGGVNIAPETVRELARIDNIVGVKDSSGNWPQFQKLLQRFAGSGFKVIQGLPEYAAASFLAGADGLTPLYAILFPELYKQLYEAGNRKDSTKAFELQAHVNSVAEISNLGVSPMSVQKYAVSLLGLTHKRAARPCEPLTPEQEARIKEAVGRLREAMPQ